MFNHKARWLALAVSFVACGSAVIWFGAARERSRTILAVPAQAIAAEQSSIEATSSFPEPAGSTSTQPERLAQGPEAELNAAWEDLLSVLPPASSMTPEPPTSAEFTPGILLGPSDQVLSSPPAGNPTEPDSGIRPGLDTQPSTPTGGAGTDPKPALNTRAKATTDHVQPSRARLLERQMTAKARRERNAVSRRETNAARRRAERLEAPVQPDHQRTIRREASQTQIAARDQRRTAMMSEDVRPSPAIQLPQGLLPSHAR
jgi:hypothetical protein